MLTRRLLPVALMPLVALPRAAGFATAAAAPEAGARHCGDPGGRFIACEAVREMLPLATRPRCPLCGGSHRLMDGG
jgi:hypothetical protein